MRILAWLTLVVVVGCSSQEPLVKDGPLDGTPEDAPAVDIPPGRAVNPAGIPIGTKLWATTNVNLRKGSATQDAVLHVIPQDDSVVTVNRTTAENGYLNVKHSGVEGWAFAAYLTDKAPTTMPPPSSSGDEAVARAKTGVGFSYWWGHGRWLLGGPTSQTAGTCSGSCPSCTHGGSYGADCSGFVAKVWQVPSSNSDVSIDSHPYSTFNFDNETTHWKVVDRGKVQPGDAMVYNDGSAGHVFLYEKGDGWGSMWAYEAKGCSYGIVHDLRTATSSYKAIRRDGY